MSPRTGAHDVVQRVGPRYAAAAVSILQEVAQWLIDRRMELWPADGFRELDFSAFAEAGELVMGFHEGEPVACMLLQQTDALYWPNEARGTALYIHKVGVRRRWAGQSWSTRLIDWAAIEARSTGTSRLRLDTVPRPALLGLYEAHGFRIVDAAPVIIRDRLVVRMERLLSSD